MQIINMSKTKLNSLEPLILPKNVTSTECEFCLLYTSDAADEL